MIGTFLDIDTGAELEDVVLDVVASITYSMSGTATMSPVGKEVTAETDHFIDSPDVLNIVCSVHDARVGFEESPGRAGDIVRTLRSWKRSGRRVGFVSGLLIYGEVLITDINVVETPDQEDAYPMALIIQEVNTAEARIEAVPPGAPDPNDAATKASARNRNRQNLKDTAEETERQSSTLFDVFYGE